MKTITLYRRDFVSNMTDTDSSFEDVLKDLDILQEDWDDIDTIEIKIDSFTTDLLN